MKEDIRVNRVYFRDVVTDQDHIVIMVVDSSFTERNPIEYSGNNIYRKVANYECPDIGDYYNPEGEENPEKRYYYVVSVYSDTNKRLLWKVLTRRLQSYNDAVFQKSWLEETEFKGKKKELLIVSKRERKVLI